MVQKQDPQWSSKRFRVLSHCHFLYSQTKVDWVAIVLLQITYSVEIWVSNVTPQQH